MKKIIKRPISVFSGESPDYAITDQSEMFEYPHDSRMLEEIAGAVFNQYLVMEKRENYNRMGRQFTFQLKPRNPNRAGLYSSAILSEDMVALPHDSERIMVEFMKHSIEELLGMAMQNVNVVHNLKNSFWKRLKFLFLPAKEIKKY